LPLEEVTMPTAQVPAKFNWWVVIGLGVLLGLIIAVVVISLELTSPKRDDFNPLSEADVNPPPMVLIPGGSFTMGTDDGPPDERPAHSVTIRSFRMDVTEVTNAQFAAFVNATGYQTISELPPDPKLYPGVDATLLRAGSAVYKPVDASLDPQTWDQPHPPWWEYMPGANWRHPEGPKSNLRGRMQHPVVHIAWADAVAYANWAKKRLPTEAEWEYAARGGLDRQPFCWGKTLQGEGGRWHANTFQGKFPGKDSGLDGFAGLAPVKSFAPNGYGLYDMSGNAWEWCADWYDSTYYAKSLKDNPQGPATGEGDPFSNQAQRVRRGGSYLCDDSYCRRYLPSARDKNPPDSSASHTGFRCVREE
jgi:formylglycine-generating enzyme